MNVSQIVSMAGRMLVRTLLKKGINAGLNRTFGSGKKPENMTPQERAQHQQSAQNVKQARKSLRTAKRFGRF